MKKSSMSVLFKLELGLTYVEPRSELESAGPADCLPAPASHSTDRYESGVNLSIFLSTSQLEEVEFNV